MKSNLWNSASAKVLFDNMQASFNGILRISVNSTNSPVIGWFIGRGKDWYCMCIAVKDVKFAEFNTCARKDVEWRDLKKYFCKKQSTFAIALQISKHAQHSAFYYKAIPWQRSYDLHNFHIYTVISHSSIPQYNYDNNYDYIISTGRPSHSRIDESQVQPNE